MFALNSLPINALVIHCPWSGSDSGGHQGCEYEPWFESSVAVLPVRYFCEGSFASPASSYPLGPSRSTADQWWFDSFQGNAHCEVIAEVRGWIPAILLSLFVPIYWNCLEIVWPVDDINRLVVRLSHLELYSCLQACRQNWWPRGYSTWCDDQLSKWLEAQTGGNLKLMIDFNQWFLILTWVDGWTESGWAPCETCYIKGAPW